MSLQNDYTKSYPLDVRLLNQDHESVLYISNDPQNVSITITNVSDEAIQFNSPESSTSADDFHQILVTFKPDIIDPTNDITVSSDHSWAMGKAKVATNGSIIVAFQLSEVLVLQPAEQTTIALANLKANASSGARVTQVQVNVDEISFTSDTNKLIPYTLTTQLSIINQRGKKNIPLHFGFAGSNTILNDGVSASKLTLQITNIATINSLNPDLSEITFNCDSESNSQSYFTISFLASDDKNTENALADASDISGIIVTDLNKSWSTNEDVQGSNADWILTPSSVLPPMKSGESIDLDISNIISSAGTGLTYMKVSYFNIPGYWDGDVMVPIMKQPLVMRSLPYDSSGNKGSVVGIGMMPKTESTVTVDDNPSNTGNLIVEGNVQVNGRIADTSGGTVPAGAIIMWSGPSDQIPDGWALCNGENKTPNLTDRFVMGSGTYVSHAEGGRNKITLSEDQLPKHKHDVTIPESGAHKHRLYVDSGSGGNSSYDPIDYNILTVEQYGKYEPDHRAIVDADISAHTHEVEENFKGSNAEIDITPPFYTLCFIIKLDSLTGKIPTFTPTPSTEA
ncbi:MAG: hypothetical protein R8G66_03840 [Cytophagales bacterium]|nr:hypothetical protein [Cytophagales bacterium]